MENPPTPLWNAWFNGQRLAFFGLSVCVLCVTWCVQIISLRCLSLSVCAMWRAIEHATDTEHATELPATEANEFSFLLAMRPNSLLLLLSLSLYRYAIFSCTSIMYSSLPSPSALELLLGRRSRSRKRLPFSFFFCSIFFLLLNC